PCPRRGRPCYTRFLRGASRCGIEERFDIGVYHPVPSAVHALSDLLHRLVRTPPRPKPIGTGPKVGFEDRLQDDLDGRLDDPIPYRRNPQRPLAPACLWDPHPAHGPRPVAALPQLGGQLPQDPRDPPLLDLLDALPIRARGPPVGLHLLPRPLQDVRAGHLVVERVEPSRGPRLRGPVQCSLESSGGVAGVVSRSGIHRPLPPPSTPTKYGPFPPPRFWCRGLPGTMGRSDSRSALTPFAVVPLIGLGAPRPPRGRHPRGLSAGAETGLSCSHTGCPTIPRPLRRRVRRGCASQLFTPSMAFAQRHEARLPVGPTFRSGHLHDAAGFASCCGLVGCTGPWPA